MSVPPGDPEAGSTIDTPRGAYAGIASSQPVVTNSTAISRLTGLHIAAMVTIALSWCGYMVMTWFHEYHRLVQARAVGTQPVRGQAEMAASATFAAALVAAIFLFIVWLWKARRSGELLCAAQHRRRRGWVIGSWFCPIVNLWFPYQIVSDVWKASDPKTPPVTQRLSALHGNWRVRLWWLLVIAALFAEITADWYARSQITAEALEQWMHYTRLASLAWLGATAMIIRVIRQVTAWQMFRRRWPTGAVIHS